MLLLKLYQLPAKVQIENETVEKLPKILTFLKFLEKKLSKKHKKGSLNNLENAPKMIDILALGS